ncbi:MAG: NAD(P)H-dependent oxidoreductase [Limnobacter sp.]|nr:NAD(P)H-dependent oxidoreductase [Limnobacter sp.]
MKFLGISGSLRKASNNTGLLRAAQQNLPAGVTMEIADLSEVPFFNSDLTERPASVERLFKQMAEADAFVLACPEYNYSLAPALKNAIDWASRFPDNTLLAGKACAIVSSGGGMGGARSQYHFRQVCVYVDLHPLNKPEVFAKSFSDSFDTYGNLVDQKVIALLAEQMATLKKWAQKLSPN